jgi:YHS domain-containing protein
MKSLQSIGLLISFLVTLLLSYGFGTNGTAAGEEGSKDRAIRGYDPIAYFKAGDAQKGDPSHSVSWHNLTWHFQNEDHRRLFQENPEKYAPQYDGYCAWAMTEARKAETDPEVWKIVDGKLYLNCSMAAYEKWSKDIPGNIRKADANWAKLHASK